MTDSYMNIGELVATLPIKDKWKSREKMMRMYFDVSAGLTPQTPRLAGLILCQECSAMPPSLIEGEIFKPSTPRIHARRVGSSIFLRL